MISLSQEEFYKQWRRGVIACAHTSFGNSYGLDSSFGASTAQGATILHSMRNLVVLNDIKTRAAERGLSVVNILITADEESLRDRILQRTATADEKAARIVTVQDDLAWIRRHKDQIPGMFGLIVDNSDLRSLRKCVDEIHELITSGQEAPQEHTVHRRLTRHAADGAYAGGRRG